MRWHVNSYFQFSLLIQNHSIYTLRIIVLLPKLEHLSDHFRVLGGSHGFGIWLSVTWLSLSFYKSFSHPVFYLWFSVTGNIRVYYWLIFYICLFFEGKYYRYFYYFMSLYLDCSLQLLDMFLLVLWEDFWYFQLNLFTFSMGNKYQSYRVVI